MFWSRLNKRRVMTPSERFIAEHSAWLTAAMAQKTRTPRIPVKPVSRGGYDALRKRPGGKERAARWWSIALGRVETTENDG